MGIDAKSDPWSAFCFDEACYLWGRHVDAELSKAVREAKNDKAAQTKGMMTLQRLLRDEETEEPSKRKLTDEEREATYRTTDHGKFRDPAELFAKAKKK